MEARLDQLQLVLKTIAKQGNPQSPYWFMGLEESTDPNYTADQQILTQYQTASEQAAGKIIPLSYARVRKAYQPCLLYTSPSPRDGLLSRMPSSA